MDIKEVREKYPQYSDLSDDQLLDGLHSKFYSDIPKDEFLSKFTPVEPEQPQEPVKLSLYDQFKQSIGQYVEPMAAIASGGVGQIIGGASSALYAPFAGSEAASDMVQPTADRFTYEPRMQESKENLQAIGEFVQPVVEPIVRGVNNFANSQFDKAQQLKREGRPLTFRGAEVDPAVLGAMTKTAPVAAAEMVGLKGLSSVRKGTRLLTPDGAPTKELEVILNKKGLVFENLTPEAKQAIPEFADPKLLPSPKAEGEVIGKGAQLDQLRTGGRDDALAPFDYVKGRKVKNPLAEEALKNGWKEGTVQMVKTSSPKTKKVMDKMLNMRWRMLKNDSGTQDLFPLNAVGDSFMDRITLISDKANKARLKLDHIAKTKLPGVKINAFEIEDTLLSSLDDLGVKYTIDQSGRLPFKNLDFSNSIIKVNKPAQSSFKNLLHLMDDTTPPDAARLHQFKRQLDDLIDFKKKSKEGLSENVRGILKKLRSKTNDILRDSIDEYAEVNDVMSSVLGAMDEFKTASKLDINLLSDPRSAIGQEMRKLHTNYKSREFIKQAALRIDEVANDLGGKFETNYTDLAQFANRMDEVFGASKSGSFAGLTEAATSYAVEGTPGLVRRGVKAAGEGIDRLKGRDPFGSYQSMKRLINQR